MDRAYVFVFFVVVVVVVVVTALAHSTKAFHSVSSQCQGDSRSLDVPLNQFFSKQLPPQSATLNATTSATMPKKYTRKHHRDASSVAERSKVPEQPRVPSQEIATNRTSHKSSKNSSEPSPNQPQQSTQPIDNTSAPLCPSCARDPTSVPNPAVDRQLQTDRIESLKLSTKEFEAENLRLNGILEDKRKELAENTNQLRRMVGKNEFKKRMREVAKQRKNKSSVGV
jgi:hypothetical protein